MLHLIANAYRRQDALDPALRADVRQAVGWPVSRDALLADPGTLRVQARWTVMAAFSTVQPDKLRRVETWLARGDGAVPGFAVLVDFVPVSAGVTGMMFTPGEAVEAELAFYPGAVPLRALIVAQRDAAAVEWVAPGCSLAEAMAGYDAALARRPWLGEWPIAAGGVEIRAAAGQFHAVSDGVALPLGPQSDQVAALVAGGAVGVFGLWNGRVPALHYAQTPLGPWMGA